MKPPKEPLSQESINSSREQKHQARPRSFRSTSIPFPTFSSQKPLLPTITLLHKIHIPIPPPPNRPSHIIRQPPRPTNTNAHRPNLSPTLHLNKCINIRSAGKHLDRRTWAMNLPRTPRSRNKQLYPKDFPSAIKSKDGCHPRPYPF